MEPNSYFKTTCSQCGEHIEAPTHGAGIWIRCPHCGEKTQLGGAEPDSPQAPAVAEKKSNRWIWVLIVLGVIAALGFVLMNRRSRTTITAQPPTNVEATAPVAAPTPAPEPDLWKGLKPGPVTIEKSPKSRLAYATGTIRNDTDKQRFGVKIALDILDAQGEKLGTTTDYTQFIDAHKEWTFKAMLAYPKAATAKVASITEE